VRAVATLDGAWSYDAGAYESLLLKSARVILAPLGLNPADLDDLTNPSASRI
jgi:cobalamin biosynthesis protein CobD/CbiB